MSEGGPFGESKAVVGSSDAIGWWCRQCEISGTGFLRRSDELVMQKKIDSGCVCQDLVFTIFIIRQISRIKRPGVWSVAYIKFEDLH